MKRGSYDSAFDNISKISLVRYNDNAVVTMCSNNFSVQPLNTAKRYSRKEKKDITISQPNVITKYNKYMGGVDLRDKGSQTIDVEFWVIHQYFPIRGHSFLPCDRDFGSVKRLVQRSDRIYLPEEYQQLILDARKTNPFAITPINFRDIIEFKSWWPHFYKKTSKNIDPRCKDTFAVSQYRQLTYSSDGGLAASTFKLVKPNVTPKIPETSAYREPVPINAKKMTDIKNVLKYIPSGETLKFYYHIVSWKTTTQEDEEG
ncbi:Transposase IS4 [Popillia japonica]|uniref:Transposase IS4 n=1 Tax=Popillia japonica TaxID=7064 RepID=A0AAW1L9E9_POPJA